jgi:hypothetical protein
LFPVGPNWSKARLENLTDTIETRMPSHKIIPLSDEMYVETRDGTRDNLQFVIESNGGNELELGAKITTFGQTVEGNWRPESR